MIEERLDYHVTGGVLKDQMTVLGAADQRICFRYMDSTFPFLPKSKISSL